MANMYMVSCRREFWSANEFSTADEIRHLDLNGNGQALSVPPATFLAAMAGKRVTVLVHGYNNEQQDVLDSYGTIDEQMRLLGFLGRANAPYDAPDRFRVARRRVRRVVPVRSWCAPTMLRRASASSWPRFKDPARSSTSTHTPSVRT